LNACPLCGIWFSCKSFLSTPCKQHLSPLVCRRICQDLFHGCCSLLWNLYFKITKKGRLRCRHAIKQTMSPLQNIQDCYTCSFVAFKSSNISSHCNVAFLDPSSFQLLIFSSFNVSHKQSFNVSFTRCDLV